MSNAWLTPDELPETLTCVRVFLPNGEAYAAALRGAIHLLALAYNWEEHGTETPEDVAQLWIDANNETFKWRTCMQAGMVMWWCRQHLPPKGFLWCDGASYAVDDYPELFDAIGYKWGGSGDNFNILNLKSKMVFSVENIIQVGQSSGSERVTIDESEIPPHQHSIDMSVVLVAPGVIPVYGPGVVPLITTNNTGGGTSHENRMPFVRLMPVMSTGQ